MASLIYGNNGNIGKSGIGYEEPVKTVKPSSSNVSLVSKPVTNTSSYAK